MCQESELEIINIKCAGHPYGGGHLLAGLHLHLPLRGHQEEAGRVKWNKKYLKTTKNICSVFANEMLYHFQREARQRLHQEITGQHRGGSARPVTV